MEKPKHDRFFSKSIEYLPIARAFFKQHIPSLFAPSVDLNTLTRSDRKNTDQNLEQKERDIIYRAILGGTDTCFLVCEHQSQESREIPLRLLRYHFDTLSMHIDAGNEDWPLIIGILFYHGEKSPYPYHSESTSYYKQPTLGDKSLYYKFWVTDITKVTDKEIIAHGICAPMELLLKHGRDGEFELDIDAYREVFHDCVEAVGDRYIETMLTYATFLSDFEVGEKIYTFIGQVLAYKKDIIMTYGEKLMKSGEQRGEQRGMIKERFQVAKSMLQEGLPRQTIQKVTGLSQEEVNKL